MGTTTSWTARWLPVFPAVFACNSMLHNDPILMDEDEPGSGGTSGAGSESDGQGAGAAGRSSAGEGDSETATGCGGEDHSASMGIGSDPGSTDGLDPDPSSTTGAGTTSSSGAGGTMTCDPGPEPETEQACCSTGKRTRNVTLDASSCTYNLGDWSACSVPETCQPGDTKNCSNGDACGVVRCNDQCSWGACEPKVAGGCLRIREPNGNDGSNYRCCASGAWEFCLKSCQWSADCESCAPGKPDWCEC